MGEQGKTLNFNLGILGHVDSGKTSLAKALSTIASTAAFDKNPQSKERGITIDLGFSSFETEAPSHIQEQGYSRLQFTLVDCPGHASLIRTIIGGAQIIDGMILVIDITKGIQTQTAECIVIGQILCKQLIVVLNKLDLIPEIKRAAVVEKVSKKVLHALKGTKFSESKVIATSASPGGSDSKEAPSKLNELIKHLSNTTYIPTRHTNKPLVISVDHCFGIKGQGTVITGTILQGQLSVNEIIDIPTLKISKKVKSLQMFRKPVEKAEQGDRVGICVTQFDPTFLERSLIGSSNFISIVQGFIAKVKKIGYYKGEVRSKAKFHISLGHDTVMASVNFFGGAGTTDEFDIEREFLYRDYLPDNSEETSGTTFGIIQFDKSLALMPDSHFIASKLDMDVHTTSCRIAFWGTAIKPLLEGYKTTLLPTLKIFKTKQKEGIVERMNTDCELIVKNLLKKGTDMHLFTGLTVNLSTGESGTIDGTFGQSGKTKVCLNGSLETGTKQKLVALNERRKRNKKTEKRSSCSEEPIVVSLHFKKYIFSTKKEIIQTK